MSDFMVETTQQGVELKTTYRHFISAFFRGAKNTFRAHNDDDSVPSTH
jgi:hypothetical protein